MDPMASEVLEAHGLDGSGHIACQLYDNLVYRADLVLGVERAHVKMLKEQVPQASERIFLLDRCNGRDIPDPYRQQRPAFDRAYDMIDVAVKSWLPDLSSESGA